MPPRASNEFFTAARGMVGKADFAVIVCVLAKMSGVKTRLRNDNGVAAAA